MTKPKTIAWLILVGMTALFLGITMSVPDHGNGNGWEYGWWLTLTLYPAWYGVLGIAVGLFLPRVHMRRNLLIHFAVLYGIFFAADLICWLASGQMPELLPFAAACLLYPLTSIIASLLTAGIRFLCISMHEFSRKG